VSAATETFTKMGADGWISKTVKELGREQKGEDRPDLADLGPRRLRNWGAYVWEAIQEENDVPAEVWAHFSVLWEFNISKAAAVTGLAGDCKLFKWKALKTGKGGHRIQYSFSKQEAMRNAKNLFRHSSWQRKAGLAPRSGLERQARVLLDRVR
jgi:hypothetical protein